MHSSPAWGPGGAGGAPAAGRWGRRGGRRVTDDAAIAVLLTAMFSLGVLLVSRRTSYTADLSAFLFGRILTVTTRQLAETTVLVVIVLALVAVGARATVLRAFDPVGAAAAGYRVGLLDVGLNLVVALVVVAAVRAVGTVLVVALLIVPAATARLVTHRLAAMAAVGTLVTAAAGYVGLVASWTASVQHGLRVTSSSAVVLALVCAYLLALPVGLARRARTHAASARARVVVEGSR